MHRRRQTRRRSGQFCECHCSALHIPTPRIQPFALNLSVRGAAMCSHEFTGLCILVSAQPRRHNLCISCRPDLQCILGMPPVSSREYCGSTKHASGCGSVGLTSGTSVVPPEHGPRALVIHGAPPGPRHVPRLRTACPAHTSEAARLTASVDGISPLAVPTGQCFMLAGLFLQRYLASIHQVPCMQSLKTEGTQG